MFHKPDIIQYKIIIDNQGKEVIERYTSFTGTLQSSYSSINCTTVDDRHYFDKVKNLNTMNHKNCLFRRRNLIVFFCAYFYGFKLPLMDRFAVSLEQ